MRLHFFTRNWTLNFPEFFKWWHNRVIYCFVVKPSDWFKKIGISFLWKNLDLVSNPSNPETVIFSIPDLRKAQKTTIILLFTPFWSKLVWFGKNQKPKLIFACLCTPPQLGPSTKYITSKLAIFEPFLPLSILKACSRLFSGRLLEWTKGDIGQNLPLLK